MLSSFILILQNIPSAFHDNEQKNVTDALENSSDIKEICIETMENFAEHH